MKILITGFAGFIGFHAAREFLRRGWDVAGVDNFCDYYDVKLKRDRAAMLGGLPRLSAHELDICDLEGLRRVFADEAPDVVLNLAAQPGVRYSITHPFVYQKTNIEGFLNILECCRHAAKVPKLVFASSSSVYGGNRKMPFEESDQVDTPVSLYAATKKANELMAHCYSHLYGMQTLGFRFFTVYGPWGRPDMAAYLFADAMAAGRPIKVFNNGDMYRDFTYIDDIIAGLVACIFAENLPQYEVYNIGNHRSERLMDMIAIIAKEMGVEKPLMEFLPMQDGDVPATYASVEKLHKAVGYEPTTPITVGLPKFIAWFKEWRGRQGGR